MNGAGRKDWGTVLLALEPLSQDERRLRRRLIRVLLYAYAALLFILFLVFPHHGWLVWGLWSLVLIILVSWYWVAIKRSVKAGNLKSDPEERAKSQRKMRRQLRTTPYWFFLIGAGFLIGSLGASGSKTALYVAAAVSIALGLLFLVYGSWLLRRSSTT
jgi:Ca2+/Na+ antiporter